MRNIVSFKNNLTINTKTIGDVVRFLELRKVGLNPKQAYAMVNRHVNKKQKFPSEYDYRAKSTKIVKKLLNNQIGTIKRESLTRGLDEYKILHKNCSQEIINSVNKEIQHRCNLQFLNSKIPDPELDTKRQRIIRIATERKPIIPSHPRRIIKRKHIFNKYEKISKMNQYKELLRLDNTKMKEELLIRNETMRLLKISNEFDKYPKVIF